MICRRCRLTTVAFGNDRSRNLSGDSSRDVGLPLAHRTGRSGSLRVGDSNPVAVLLAQLVECFGGGVTDGPEQHAVVQEADQDAHARAPEKLATAASASASPHEAPLSCSRWAAARMPRARGSMSQPSSVATVGTVR